MLFNSCGLGNIHWYEDDPFREDYAVQGFIVTLNFFLTYQVFEFSVFIYTRSFILEMDYVVFSGVRVYVYQLVILW